MANGNTQNFLDPWWLQQMKLGMLGFPYSEQPVDLSLQNQPGLMLNYMNPIQMYGGGNTPAMPSTPKQASPVHKWTFEEIFGRRQGPLVSEGTAKKGVTTPAGALGMQATPTPPSFASPSGKNLQISGGGSVTTPINAATLVNPFTQQAQAPAQAIGGIPIEQAVVPGQQPTGVVPTREVVGQLNTPGVGGYSSVGGYPSRVPNAITTQIDILKGRPIPNRSGNVTGAQPQTQPAVDPIQDFLDKSFRRLEESTTQDKVPGLPGEKPIDKSGRGTFAKILGAGEPDYKSDKLKFSNAMFQLAGAFMGEHQEHPLAKLAGVGAGLTQKGIEKAEKTAKATSMYNLHAKILSGEPVNQDDISNMSGEEILSVSTLAKQERDKKDAALERLVTMIWEQTKDLREEDRNAKLDKFAIDYKIAEYGLNVDEIRNRLAIMDKTAQADMMNAQANASYKQGGGSGNMDINAAAFLTLNSLDPEGIAALKKKSTITGLSAWDILFQGASQGAGTDTLPPGVPPGSVQIQGTQMWRAPDGQTYAPQGQ